MPIRHIETADKFTATEFRRRLREGISQAAERKTFTKFEIGSRLLPVAIGHLPTAQAAFLLDDDLDDFMPIDGKKAWLDQSDLLWHGAVVHVYCYEGNPADPCLNTTLTIWTGTPDRPPVLLQDPCHSENFAPATGPAETAVCDQTDSQDARGTT